MRSSRIILSIFLLLAFHLGEPCAQESAFKRANVLYEAESFDKAAAIYDSLIQIGYVTPELFFNAGNAQYKLKDHAKAILNYEKALTLGENEHVRANLEMAQTMISAPIAKFSEFFIYRWWAKLMTVVGPNGYAVLSIIAFTGGLLILYLHWFRSSMQGRSGWIAGALLMLSVISILLSTASRAFSEKQVFAIVMVESTDMFEASDERSEMIRELSAGIKVRCVDQIGEWVKAELPDRDIGWVNESNIARIQ
jgi:tetratricopeptide (TPR) repeat protein